MNWQTPIFTAFFSASLFILHVFSASREIEFVDGMRTRTDFIGRAALFVMRPLAAINSYLPIPGYRRYVEKLLSDSGDMATKFEVFLARQEALAVICPVLLAIALDDIVLEYVLLGVMFGLFIPIARQSANRTRRMKLLKKELPYFMDLLTLSVEAGADFAFAIGQIIESIGDGPMRQELQLMMTRMKGGSSRREAIASLADRADFPDMRSLCNALIQSDETGTSLVSVLRSQSSFIHTRQTEEWREKAKKASTKIIIPLVLLIFPTMFLIILGPVALTLWEIYLANT